MNLPEMTFGLSRNSAKRPLRADRGAFSGLRFLTVLNTNAQRNTSQLLSDGCFMALPVVARRTSSLPEEQGASSRSAAAWRLEQAEHSYGPTASAEFPPLATDERALEDSHVGLSSALSQRLLNDECAVVWLATLPGGNQSAKCCSGASDRDSESEWVHVAN